MASSRAFTYSRCVVRLFQQPRSPFQTIPRRAPRRTPRSHAIRLNHTKRMSTSELEDLLAEPTWSVESLLPPKTPTSDAPKISPQQLHHLLRLSALPLPNTPGEEKKMLDTLSAQLHFVGEIQQVDTIGVKPLRAIRDETAAAEEEQTITLETLREALAKEMVIGKHYNRIQRDTSPVDASDVESWDVLGSAEKKVGKYFVVESERPQE